MARDRKGSVVERNGKIYARVQFIGTDGRKRDLWRKAENRTQARKIIKDLLKDAEKGDGYIDASRMTFNDLCDFYEKHYLNKPKYVEGRKVAGLRSHITVKGYITALRKHFGKQKLQSISYEHIKAFQLLRLKTSTRNHKTRSLTTVNRELAYLRRVFNIAVRKDWLAKNPFQTGDTLIHTADEPKRDRILTQNEEKHLLFECETRMPLLKSLVILALDTGCRQNELLQLTWQEVDFQANTICLLAFNTKTARERFVGITARVRNELLLLWENSSQDIEDFVFQFPNRHRVQYYFKAACEKASIQNLRFHDLRHTHATRLDDLGFSLAKIGGQLGHTVLQTTLRYVNRDKSTVQQVVLALDDFYCSESNMPTLITETIN